MHSLVLDYPKARLHFQPTFDTPTQTLGLLLGQKESPEQSPFLSAGNDLLREEEAVP